MEVRKSTVQECWLLFKKDGNKHCSTWVSSKTKQKTHPALLSHPDARRPHVLILFILVYSQARTARVFEMAIV